MPDHLTDDRRRPLALLAAGLRGDHEGLERVLGSDVIPPVRDPDVDALGWALDKRRADPVAAMVGDLLAVAAQFAVDLHGSKAAAAEAVERELRSLD